MKIIATILTLTAILTGIVIAQTVQPYADGSATDEILSFNGASDSTVTANLTRSIFGGSSTANKQGSGGGWTLNASGSNKVILGIISNTQAETKTGDDYLDFGVRSSGLLGGVISIATQSTWSANADIVGSDTWEAGTATYNFNLNMNTGLLSLDLSAFNGITLKITDKNGTPLYQNTSLANLLGVVDVVNSNNNVSVDFAYDPSMGPINIEWSARQGVGLQLADIFGGNTNSLYRISDTSFTITSNNTVPESSTAVLLGLGSLGLLIRRK